MKHAKSFIMTKKIEYPFWVVQYDSKGPSRAYEDQIAESYYAYIFQNDNVKTIGDAQHAMYKGLDGNFLGNVPFSQAYPNYYKGHPVFSGNTFKMAFGGQYQDIYHSIGHFIAEGAHTFAGEIKVAIAESALYSKNADRLIEAIKTYAGYVGDFKPALQIEKFQDSMESFRLRGINGMGSIVELSSYDFMPEFKLNKFNKIDIEKSPEISGTIIMASYKNENFKQNAGGYVGSFHGYELFHMPKEYIMIDNAQKKEISDILDYNTNPGSKIIIESLSPIAQRTQSYIDILKQSARVSVKEPMLVS